MIESIYRIGDQLFDTYEEAVQFESQLLQFKFYNDDCKQVNNFSDCQTVEFLSMEGVENFKEWFKKYSVGEPHFDWITPNGCPLLDFPVRCIPYGCDGRCMFIPYEFFIDAYAHIMAMREEG